MESNKKEIRDIRAVFLIFSFIFSLLAYKSYPSLWSFAFIALVFVLVGLLTFSPMTLKPLFSKWLIAAHIVGKFNMRVLLGVLFFFVFVPVGILMKILGKDPIVKGFDDRESYWEEYSLEGLKDKSCYERQF